MNAFEKIIDNVKRDFKVDAAVNVKIKNVMFGVRVKSDNDKDVINPITFLDKEESKNDNQRYIGKWY